MSLITKITVGSLGPWCFITMYLGSLLAAFSGSVLLSLAMNIGMLITVRALWKTGADVLNTKAILIQLKSPERLPGYLPVPTDGGWAYLVLGQLAAIVCLVDIVYGVGLVFVVSGLVALSALASVLWTGEKAKYKIIAADWPAE